ncbi:MAG: hypothetical protein HYS22_06905 [Deltaproteobacteria bacterium]|nr:hypothetical protein [Deltaproteobacteria bacterium]
MKKLLFIVIVAGFPACGSSSSGDTLSEAEILETKALAGGTVATATFVLESEFFLGDTEISITDATGSGVKVAVLQTAEEVQNHGLPDLTGSVDFSKEWVILVQTVQTGGCFTGYTLSRVAERGAIDVETGSALKVFLRGADSSVGEEETPCTADLRSGYNRFYKITPTQIDTDGFTTVAVDYRCSSDTVCKILP